MSDLLTSERDLPGDTGETSRGIAHWPALDGLRGVAVAGVVAYHLGWISGGFLGVDLFFALSGFLITTLLVREQHDTGRVDLRRFWGRRFRRLLPAVMALVVGVLAWTWVWGTPAEQAGARTDARWSIAYLANWHFVAEARDYWAAATDSSVFTHLWSLAIEEQFYLVWPLVAWWALRSRSGAHRLAIVSAVGAIASAAAMVLLYDPDAPSRVYLGTDTRAVALLLGALAALPPFAGACRRIAASRPGRTDAAVAAIAVALGVWWVIGGDHLGVLLQGGLPVHSLSAAVLVALLAAGSDARARSAAALDRPWLVWLGQRSYGVYLWHWPVIVLAEPRWTGLPAPVRDAAMVALSLVSAEVSFRLLEHPVRRRAGWAAGVRASWATVAVSVLAIVAAAVAPSGRGHVASFDAGSLVSGSLAPDSTVPDSTVPDSTVPDSTVPDSTVPDATVPVTTLPVTTVPDSSTTAAPVPLPELGDVLWVGDSVANDLAPALVAAFATAGVTWTNGAGDGVRFTPGGGVDPVALWTGVLDGTPVDTVVLHLTYWDSPAPADVLRASFGWFRDAVVARGARLVIVTPPPVRADLVDPGLAVQVQVSQELVDAGGGTVTLVDSAPLWGPTMVADIDGDGAPDRKPDGVHVCPQGAARFAAWLVTELDARFDGVTPAPVADWAGGPWTTDVRYDTPPGACVALD